MNVKGLLLVITVLVLGIFVVLAVDMVREPDTIGEQLNEAVEEVGDEIDDNFTTPE